MATHKRSLRNVKLTADFHFRYFGLWVVITVTLVLCSNFAVFFWLQSHFLGTGSSANDVRVSFFELRQFLLWGLLLEAAVIAAALVVLAKLTAHRIAGPFIQFKKTFDAIHGGDRQARLRFRTYDGLDHVANSFNAMMDDLTKTKP